ncbi:MAG: ATP-binding protein [Planctomycetes bacterium]|nr:ATP-binding protein [Planctomycetota bacterium]MCW8134996.1 ATP-binding protein [Planctomycetota bacterium]
MESAAGKRAGLLLGWAFSMIMAGALVVGAIVAYAFIKAGYEDQLERRLKAYAATSASAFNPSSLELIDGPDDEILGSFSDRLKRHQKASGVRRAALVRRDGTLLFDTAGGAFGARDYELAADANELERCFEEGPVATIVYEDETGIVYRNAFAPVVGRDGVTSNFAVAVELEADYLDKLSYVRLTMILTVLGVFVVTLGAAAMLTRAWNRLQRDLARQTRLAEQAQFSAGMAHQIKNPLAALRGYIELLARGLHEPMQKQIADKLITETSALDRVVRDFLQFSRGAHGSVEKLTLAQALRPVLDAARTAGGDTVSVHEPELPTLEIEVDSTALREAISNVVVNAAEALSEQGGEIRIRASVHGKVVTLEIEDNGPGIPDEVRARMFQPFVTGKADGTGLGLPIARRLLRDLGGGLELVKTGPTGTMFRATFLKEAAE